MPPPNLPTELVHMILDEVAEADGPRALKPMAPVSRTFRDICRPYTWKTMVIIPRLVDALAEQLAVAPEITRYVQELYIDASEAQNYDWLRDPWPTVYGACLQQNWPKLRMLEINCFNWKALSARDQASLTALTQLPTFRELRAFCVRDISFSIFAGFRGLKHLQLTSCSLHIDVDLQRLRCTAPTCSYLETLRISQHYGPGGLETLLNYITSEASPVNLTRLRALSFDPRCDGRVKRPGLAQMLAVSSASLEVLKIEAEENGIRRRSAGGI
ncbi:hypothetical protein D9615_007268 [Tricholomella constricta]|uniref:F-box domain-containing protein n=1 Tax=Tricholomella constricta TaxID=117010 RepID=A0A8H5H531_9AGAR|nr:hypothetical protein D9615_007268 [Tricholomella constricta]